MLTLNYECGSNSVVECLLPKQNVAGSSPVSRSKLKNLTRVLFLCGDEDENPKIGFGVSEQRLESFAKVEDLKHNSELPLNASDQDKSRLRQLKTKLSC